jgi:hypothetical protein
VDGKAVDLTKSKGVTPLAHFLPEGFMQHSEIEAVMEANGWTSVGSVDGDLSGMLKGRYMRAYPDADVCFSIIVVSKGDATSIALDMFDFDVGEARLVIAMSHWNKEILERLVSRLDPHAAKAWANNEGRQEFVISRNGIIAVERGQGVITGNGMLCLSNIADAQDITDSANLQELVEGDRERSLVMDQIAKRLPIYVKKVLEVVAP